MAQLVVIALVSWLAGFAAFVGGVIAVFEGSAESELKREFVHGVVASGGGILVAAVAFALVPPGMVTLIVSDASTSSLTYKAMSPIFRL